jgi:hypothetical protein
MGTVTNIDSFRVQAVGERLLRGLYFYVKGARVPSGSKVTVAGKPGLLDDELLTIARPFTVLSDHHDRSYGDAFSCAAAFGPKESVWIMVLFDFFFWAGTTLGAGHPAIAAQIARKARGETFSLASTINRQLQ